MVVGHLDELPTGIFSNTGITFICFSLLRDCNATDKLVDRFPMYKREGVQDARQNVCGQGRRAYGH